MKFRVVVPVFVERDEIEVVVDHDGDPDTEEDRSEIYRKAVEKAIEERPLVPWLAEEFFSMGDIVPPGSKWIERIDE